MEKPFATVALIATSNFISGNIFLLVFTALAGFVFLKFFQASESGKKFFDNLLIKLPLVGDVYRNYLIASSSSIL